MILHSVNPFSLRDMTFSHGWIALAPWSWRRDPPALLRVERLPSGRVVPLEVTSADPSSPTDTFVATVPPGLNEEEQAVLASRLRWMLRLDEDLAPFHALLRTLPGGEAVAARGEGRLLRSWDFYEDAIKTLCTTNTTWAQTKSMIARLVDRFGEASEGGVAFPEPGALAEASEGELRAAGLGYRAGAARSLAAAVASGELPREALEWAMMPDASLQERLLGLKGIGPYAAANLRLLLGHYDRLAIDSWLRAAVRGAWFDRGVTDREIEATFEQFGPWRALVYWFHPELHLGRDAWREDSKDVISR